MVKTTHAYLCHLITIPGQCYHLWEIVIWTAAVILVSCEGQTWSQSTDPQVHRQLVYQLSYMLAQLL